ncbi:TPA: hypothetical protein HL326_29385 [Escherichia coli]|nr:hypothetical protein [Escherichia coli]
MPVTYNKNEMTNQSGKGAPIGNPLTEQRIQSGRLTRVSPTSGAGLISTIPAPALSLYIDLCNCLILICSIQHQMKAKLWTKNSYRL